MHMPMRSLASASVVSFALAAIVAATSGALNAQARQPAASRFRFEVSFIPQVHDGPITGRAFVMITRSIDKVPEPRLQIGRTGVPFFGHDVERCPVAVNCPASPRVAGTTLAPGVNSIRVNRPLPLSGRRSISPSNCLRRPNSPCPKRPLSPPPGSRRAPSPGRGRSPPSIPPACRISFVRRRCAGMGIARPKAIGSCATP